MCESHFVAHAVHAATELNPLSVVCNGRAYRPATFLSSSTGSPLGRHREHQFNHLVTSSKNVSTSAKEERAALGL